MKKTVTFSMFMMAFFFAIIFTNDLFAQGGYPQQKQPQHTHSWIICPLCKGAGAGFFGPEGIYTYCRRCRGCKQICKTCFTPRPIEYHAPDPNCGYCSGTGKCLTCRGYGQVMNPDFWEWETCSTCSGTKRCHCARRRKDTTPSQSK